MSVFTRVGGFGFGGGAAKPDGNPSGLTATVLSDTSIKLSWTNGTTNQDGTYVYMSTDGVDYLNIATVIGNISTYNKTGLTYSTTYFFKVVHFKGNELSNYSNIVSKNQWDKWFDQIFADFKLKNNHISTSILDTTYKTQLTTLFSESYTDSETTGYYYSTFSTKRIADFFILLFQNNGSSSRTWAKSGGNLRYNMGGDIYNQIGLPAHTLNSNNYCIISSTDGFEGVTRLDISASGFAGEICAFNYFTGLNRLNIYTNSFTSDLTNWIIPPHLSDSGFLFYRNFFTGTLDLSNVIASAKIEAGVSVHYNYLTGLKTSSNYMGATEYFFKNNVIPSADIDSFFTNLDTYYTNKTPTYNVSIDFTGDKNGYLTDYTSNIHYTHLMSLFASAGKTLTVALNDQTGLQFDKGYAVFTWDDGLS